VWWWWLLVQRRQREKSWYHTPTARRETLGAWHQPTKKPVGSPCSPCRWRDWPVAGQCRRGPFAVASAISGGTGSYSLSSPPDISDTKLVRSGILPRCIRRGQEIGGWGQFAQRRVGAVVVQEQGCFPAASDRERRA